MPKTPQAQVRPMAGMGDVLRPRPWQTPGNQPNLCHGTGTQKWVKNREDLDYQNLTEIPLDDLRKYQERVLKSANGWHKMRYYY
ncbi:MAG: hypothetical protein M1499_07940 [Firmicutes bacterium]|nr:hypothetical protein [Bacillota bacterium]MCL5972474.1 hypothetical protein [Bacillota bacterium]